MNKKSTKSMFIIALVCAMAASVKAQTNGNPGTFEAASGNSYLYHQYGDLYWMVTNSRESDPVHKTWGSETSEPKAEGENGFYYLAKEKEKACPEGWRLPTRAEGDALMETIKADKDAKAVRWWTKAGDNAFGGAIRNGGVSAGWETYGVWRLANGLNEQTGDENWAHLTMTIDPVANSGAGKWYTEIGSSKAHVYTIRCVQAVGTGSGVQDNKADHSWNVSLVGNHIAISGLNSNDLGSKVAVVDIQGIKRLESRVNGANLEIEANLPSGVYFVVLVGTRHLTAKIIKF